MQGHAHDQIVGQSWEPTAPGFLGSCERACNVDAASGERRATRISNQVLEYRCIDLERLFIRSITWYRGNWYMGIQSAKMNAGTSLRCMLTHAKSSTGDPVVSGYGDDDRVATGKLNLAD